MVSDATHQVLVITQFASAIMTVLILLRVVYILSANPIGEFAQELVYLRMRELRQAGYLVLVVLLLQLAEFVLPFLTDHGVVPAYSDLVLMANTAQAILILGATLVVLLVVRRYTHRALDRRIRESMETLAYLEGQRRRRRTVEREEYRAQDEE